MKEEQYNNLLEEIKISRGINTEEHDTIKASAAVSEHLSEQIGNALSVFNGFMKTLTFIRNLILPTALVYLVFKEPLLAMIGVQ